MTDETITGVYEFLEAVEEVIKAADPAKREALAATIEAFAEDFPEDFFWAIGPQAPTLLNHLVTSIDMAARDDRGSRPRPVIKLVDRKRDTDS